MIIAIVTFNIDSKLTDAALEDKFLETSPLFRDVSGLIRKYLKIFNIKLNYVKNHYEKRSKTIFIYCNFFYSIKRIYFF